MSSFEIPELSETLYLPQGELTIRKAIARDAIALGSVFLRGINRKEGHNDPVWGWRNPYDWAEDAIDKGHAYIGHLNDEPECIFELTSEDKGMWGILDDNAGYAHKIVAPKGLGRIIIHRIAVHTARSGGDFLRVDYPQNNESLGKIYDDLGFDRVGTKEVRMPYGLYVATLAQRDVRQLRDPTYE